MEPVVGPRRTAAALILVALVLMVAFATSYVGAFHDPAPHRIPVGLVAPSSSAGSLAAQLDRLPGRPLDARTFGDRAAALRAVAGRDVYAAYDVQANRLYVAGAANRAAAAAVELVFRGIAAERQRPAPRVVDAHPLPRADVNGTTPFYTVVAWVFGGYFGAVLMGLVRGPRSGSRRLAAERLGALALFAVLGSLLTVLALRWGYGVLEAHFVSTWLTGVLVILASAAATSGLQAVAGMAGTGLVVLLFVILGNPSSGGAYARPLLPGFWATIGGLLPPGAGVDLLRSVQYFPDAGVGGPVAVLAAWGLGGAVLALLRGGRVVDPDRARAEASAAVGAA